MEQCHARARLACRRDFRICRREKDQTSAGKLARCGGCCYVAPPSGQIRTAIPSICLRTRGGAPGSSTIATAMRCFRLDAHAEAGEFRPNCPHARRSWPSAHSAWTPCACPCGLTYRPRKRAERPSRPEDSPCPSAPTKISARGSVTSAPSELQRRCAPRWGSREPREAHCTGWSCRQQSPARSGLSVL
jgi:hypothetical protein